MMEFVLTVVGVALGILLATFVSCMIITSPKVLRIYVKRYNKALNNTLDQLMEEEA